MSAELLAARGVTRRFAGREVLCGVNLALREGELLGVVGPDGAGKSTLLRALTGLISLDGGDAAILGVSWTRAPDEARERLGYMPQHYSLYTDLSVDENLSFFAQLFDLPADVFRERRQHLLAITQLERAADRPAGALSGGMYKKLAIACALLHRPAALVLDEPTNGVDPVSRRELWSLLYEFVRGGMGVLVSTPYMDEAARCGRVVVLHEGRVLLEGEPQALVEGFPHAVVEVSARDRRPIDAYLEGDPRVLATTPAGERVRAVVRSDAAPDVIVALTGLGAHVGRTRPDFEDLYLATVAERPS